MATKIAPNQAQTSALDLAALDIAARELKKRRGELQPGQYQICKRFLVDGVITVDSDSVVSSGPSYTDALAYVLSTLSDRALRKVERALSDPDFSVDDEQKQIAKEICAMMPRNEIKRSGSIKGAVRVQEI